MVTAKMTEKAWNYVGMVHIPSKDFSDDGARFKVFKTNRGGKYEVYASYTTGDGIKFLALHEDYSNYGGTPYKWFDNFSKVNKNKWNGTTNPIDLDELKAEIDKLYEELNKAESVFNTEKNKIRAEKLESSKKAAEFIIASISSTLDKAEKYNWLKNFDSEKVSYDARQAYFNSVGKADYCDYCSSLKEVQYMYINLVKSKEKWEKDLNKIIDKSISNLELDELDAENKAEKIGESYYVSSIINTIALLDA